jgi:branched-chain amino acid transport system ATP-binding protein
LLILYQVFRRVFQHNSSRLQHVPALRDVQRHIRVLLDEPSLGLAPMIVTKIFDIIREINRQGTTILLVEQNANMALHVAQRGYVLETGRIVLEDTAENLIKNEQVKKSYLGG